MLENVENYNNIQKDIPDFNTIHNGEKIFFFTVNYDWIKFCLSSALILSKRGCFIDL